MPDVTVSSDVDSFLRAANLAAMKTQLGVGRTATAIAYAANITPNADTTSVVNVGTLTGNITINAPTGTPSDGQLLSFRFIQDGTGRTITWNAVYDFGTDIESTDIPTTASAKFEVGCRWNAADSKWRVVALVRGF